MQFELLVPILNWRSWFRRYFACGFKVVKTTSFADISKNDQEEHAILIKVFLVPRQKSSTAVAVSFFFQVEKVQVKKKVEKCPYVGTVVLIREQWSDRQYPSKGS